MKVIISLQVDQSCRRVPGRPPAAPGSEVESGRSLWVVSGSGSGSVGGCRGWQRLSSCSDDLIRNLRVRSSAQSVFRLLTNGGR